MTITREADDIADDVIAHIRGDDSVDRDSMLEYVHETVDSCGTVIYTAKAIAYLQESDNDGAAADDGMLDAEAFKNGVPWSLMAYCALEHDVYEALEAKGFDPNDDSSWPRFQCGKCEAWVAAGEYDPECKVCGARVTRLPKQQGR